MSLSVTVDNKQLSVITNGCVTHLLLVFLSLLSCPYNKQHDFHFRNGHTASQISRCQAIEAHSCIHFDDDCGVL